MRITVVTPSLDKRHGTERALAEQVERLARQYHHEVHVYAQQIADVQIDAPNGPGNLSKGGVYWHKIPQIPGPHLLQFLWWLVCNTCIRKWRSNRDRDERIILTAGINCWDADVIIVHALFQRLRELSHFSHSRRLTGVQALRHMHRQLFYLLVSALERRIYTNRRVSLAAVSPRIAALLAQYFGRTDVELIGNGVDTQEFSPPARVARRQEARASRRFCEDDFVLLLIGNDWRIKGTPAVLSAMASCPISHLRLLAVGSDDPAPYLDLAARLGIADRCRWEGPTPDVMNAYAAADVYVSPSREDSFGLPVLEAMACGLPAITSSFAGVSSLLQNEIDSFVLSDPEGAGVLEQILKRLWEDRNYRQQIGDRAAKTAQQWSWDKSTEALNHLLAHFAAKNDR